MSVDAPYGVLMAMLSSSSAETAPGIAELDHAPAPWEVNLQATCDCLSWRGALDNLKRRQAEDELGATVYAAFPVHARSAVVTAHALIERGEISEDELAAKLKTVRDRFEGA